MPTRPESSPTPAAIAESLGRIYLFRDLDPAALARLAHAVEVYAYREAEVVAREGEPGDALWVVASGAVAVRKSDEEGKAEQVVMLAPGQHFEEHAA